MQKTKFYSYKIGNLPKGCSQCVKGEKLVLFVTGLCERKCYFCPLSDQKKNKDDIWANEWKIKSKADIIKEAKLCSAKGAGITGGDPLLKLDRTITLIKLLKKEFGKSFHIHLYTPLNLVTRQKLEKLSSADLDEIRFHPDLDDKKEWSRILYAKEFNWDIGIEIPVIPTKKGQTKSLLDFVEGKVSFINLNELEISDTNANKLAEFGFKCKDNISYAITGSEKTAKELLSYLKNKKFNVHFCTAKLKDAVQLANRIKRRAKNVSKPYDRVSTEGILTRGAVYLKDLSPSSFGYRKILDKADRKSSIKQLEKIKKELLKENKIKPEMLEIDREKLRLLTSVEILKKLKRKKGLSYAVVEEYPTHDQLELSVEFVS